MPSSEEQGRPDRARGEPAAAPLDELVAREQPAAPQGAVADDGTDSDDETLRSADLDREHADALRRVVSSKSERRIRARERPDESIWAFMSTFGIVGWSVAVPTLAGLALGVYLDRRTDSERSYTIMFLVLGVSAGCATAWYWIRRESSGGER